MTDTDLCKTCRYFDSKEWDSGTKNWCIYNNLPAIYAGPCEYYEPIVKPCPFCGSTDVHLIDNDPGRSEVSITCKDCNVWVDHMFDAMSKEEAIKLWNRRVKE